MFSVVFADGITALGARICWGLIHVLAITFLFLDENDLSAAVKEGNYVFPATFLVFVVLSFVCYVAVNVKSPGYADETNGEFLDKNFLDFLVEIELPSLPASTDEEERLGENDVIKQPLKPTATIELRKCEECKITIVSIFFVPSFQHFGAADTSETL